MRLASLDRKTVLVGVLLVTLLALSAVPVAWAAAVPASKAPSSTSPEGSPVMLSSPNAQPNGSFGFSVASRGKVATVGAPGESADGVSGAGRAYVFYTNSGALISTLSSPNPELNGHFGWAVDFGSSVAAGGKIAIVSAPFESVAGQSGAGRVYIFNATTGSLRTTLTSPNPASGGKFGYSIALRGGDVFVGAPMEPVTGQSGAGRVYVFSVVSGHLSAEFSSPNAQTNGTFGWSVAARGNVVVVGAPNETSGMGRAYVFNARTGALLSTLSSPNEQANGKFGASVAAATKIVLVGAPGESSEGQQAAGNAYVFDATTGALISALASPSPQRDGGFGDAVALRSDTAIVGAPYEPASGQNGAGHVYVFDGTTGVLMNSLASPHPQSDGRFGSSVAARNKFAIVGAPNESASGQSGAGNAYVFIV